MVANLISTNLWDAPTPDKSRADVSGPQPSDSVPPSAKPPPDKREWVLFLLGGLVGIVLIMAIVLGVLAWRGTQSETVVTATTTVPAETPRPTEQPDVVLPTQRPVEFLTPTPTPAG